jgi:hypothetical protein
MALAIACHSFKTPNYKPAIGTKVARVLVSQQDAEIAKIVPSRTGDDGVAKRVKKGMGIKAGERVPHSFAAGQVASMIANSINGAAINHGAGGRTVPVDAVGPGAEHSNVLS